MTHWRRPPTASPVIVTPGFFGDEGSPKRWIPLVSVPLPQASSMRTRDGPYSALFSTKRLDSSPSRSGKLAAYKSRDRWIPVPLPPPVCFAKQISTTRWRSFSFGFRRYSERHVYRRDCAGPANIRFQASPSLSALTDAAPVKLAEAKSVQRDDNAAARLLCTRPSRPVIVSNDRKL